MTADRTAYAQAGVDVAAADRAVDLLRARLTVASGDLLGGIGGFGAALEIPSEYRQPVLLTATDGVGTKTDIARRLGRYDTIGQDLVAMCVDDIVCHGARPAYFLDYLAVGRVEPERVAQIVGGIAAACAAVGCAVVGGETAEHPGLIEPDEFDLAGFVIGFAERDELIDGSAARAGDVVLGLASSGLHANGYSLVRALLERGALALEDDLLTPTRLYAPAVLALIDALRANGLRLGGMSHVTGGGLAANLPRAIGQSLGLQVDPRNWSMPPVFERVAAAGAIGWPEMRATFNCGIGFAAVLEPAAVGLATALLANHGIEAWAIGGVASVADLGARYVEVA